MLCPVHRVFCDERVSATAPPAGCQIWKSEFHHQLWVPHISILRYGKAPQQTEPAAAQSRCSSVQILAKHALIAHFCRVPHSLNVQFTGCIRPENARCSFSSSIPGVLRPDTASHFAPTIVQIAAFPVQQSRLLNRGGSHAVLVDRKHQHFRCARP